MLKLNRRLLMAGAAAVAATTALAFSLNAGAAGAGKATIGNWGFDLASLDTSV